MARDRILRNVVLDTGPLVAILCQADAHHEVCIDVLKLVVPPLLTTWPVLTEAAWILRDEPRALERLVAPKGLFTVVQQGDDVLADYRVLMRRYKSLNPQLADLSLVKLVQDMETTAVFTLDRRDFTVYRVKGRRLRLLPESI